MKRILLLSLLAALALSAFPAAAWEAAPRGRRVEADRVLAIETNRIDGALRSRGESHRPQVTREPAGLRLSGESVRRVLHPDGSVTAFVRARGFARGTGGRDQIEMGSAWFSAYPWDCAATYYGFIGIPPGFSDEARFFATFDIGSFPDDAVITQVRSILNVWRYGGVGYLPGDLQFDYCQMDGVAGVDPCASIFPDPDDASWTTPCFLSDPGAGVFVEVDTDLGAAAAVDLQAAVAGSDDFWSWGSDWTGAVGVAYGANHYQSGEPDPVLAITYTSASAHQPSVTGVSASPGSVENIGPDTFDLTVSFTDVDGHAPDEFTLSASIRSDVGLEWFLGDPDRVESAGTNAYQAHWDDVDIRDSIEIGPYDLQVTVNDGSFDIVSTYAANPDVLTVVSPPEVFLYEDWNDFVPPPPPSGWTLDTPLGNEWDFSTYIWSGSTADQIGTADSSGLLLPPGSPSPADTQTSVWSGSLDCTSRSSVHVSFRHSFVLYGGFAAGLVEYSTDGGSGWTTAEAILAGESGDRDVELAGAAGQPDVRVRFLFQGDAGAAYWLLDVIQVWDAPPSPVLPAGGLVVSPSSVAAVTDQTVSFSGSFTDADSTVADLSLTLEMRSPEDLVWIAVAGAADGEQGVSFQDLGGGSFAWSLVDQDFLPLPAPGDYDLQVRVGDGWTQGTDDFSANPDELTLTEDYMYFSSGYFDEGGAQPVDWVSFNDLGHTATDGWVFDLNWPASSDYTASAWYDLSGPEQSDTYLVSPTFDCSGATVVDLFYYTIWGTGWSAGSLGEIQYSTDGGTSWDWMVRYTGQSLGTSVEYEDVGWYDVSSYFAGQSQCKLRFWYWAFDDYYWLLDSVVLFSYAPPPTPTPTTPPPVPSTGPGGLAVVLAALGGLLIRRRR